MSKSKPVEVEVCIFRPNQNDEEIVIELTEPATAAAPGRRLCLTLTPKALALALTGRGAIRGKLVEHVFEKREKKETV